MFFAFSPFNKSIFVLRKAVTPGTKLKEKLGIPGLEPGSDKKHEKIGD